MKSLVLILLGLLATSMANDVTDLDAANSMVGRRGFRVRNFLGSSRAFLRSSNRAGNDEMEATELGEDLETHELAAKMCQHIMVEANQVCKDVHLHMSDACHDVAERYIGCVGEHTTPQRTDKALGESVGGCQWDGVWRKAYNMQSGGCAGLPHSDPRNGPRWKHPLSLAMSTFCGGVEARIWRENTRIPSCGNHFKSGQFEAVINPNWPHAKRPSAWYVYCRNAMFAMQGSLGKWMSQGSLYSWNHQLPATC